MTKWCDPYSLSIIGSCLIFAWLLTIGIVKGQRKKRFARHPILFKSLSTSLASPVKRRTGRGAAMLCSSPLNANIIILNPPFLEMIQKRQIRGLVTDTSLQVVYITWNSSFFFIYPVKLGDWKSKEWGSSLVSLILSATAAAAAARRVRSPSRKYMELLMVEVLLVVYIRSGNQNGYYNCLPSKKKLYECNFVFCFLSTGNGRIVRY